ncbi:hypothetical protein DM01DRAFT_1130808 [Hesseltinella vesiculosa]|uniref:Uncharacterized protein n=1 Tax=Hesseltinella vesiculosa TaxID=101127 RepID=A0A1X2G924_9FUNG|nr:hypothetical protein DM01DRAFT_1130808 [Hesseltinella vesiculosa]
MATVPLLKESSRLMESLPLPFRAFGDHLPTSRTFQQAEVFCSSLRCNDESLPVGALITSWIMISMWVAAGQ